ncbi:MAG: rhodanese-like domain-containing protein, partial [Candidatus Aminicenantes bacterium]|nr:rhodanese-like domain-containing protein [Candidatus Aminicenantes bacterium]
MGKKIITTVFLGLLAFVILACGTQEKLEEKKTYVNINAQQLNKMLEEKDFTLINVHIPYDGEIPQTDLFIPYSEVEGNADRLPQEKNAKIVIYCRSDRMSNVASMTLVEMGYTNVLNLKGGMRAWKEAG